MLLDTQALFSDQQSLVQSAGTYVSTNTIDLGANGTAVGGAVNSDLGGSQELEVVAQVTTTFTSGGSATVQAQLFMADSADLTTNPVLLCQTDAVAYAGLVAGYQFKFGTLPQGITKRYLGLKYVIGTAAVTAGKVTAGLALARPVFSVGV